METLSRTTITRLNDHSTIRKKSFYKMLDSSSLLFLLLRLCLLEHPYIDISRNPLNFISLDNIWSELARRGAARSLISRSHRSSDLSVSAKTEQFLSRRKPSHREILTPQSQHTYLLHSYSESELSISICMWVHIFIFI